MSEPNIEYSRLYFPEEDADENLLERVYSAFKGMLERHELSLRQIHEDIAINPKDVLGEEQEIDGAVLDHIRCALTRIIFEKEGVVQKTYVKVSVFPEPVAFSQLRHTMVGKIFSLVGVVTRIESSKPVASVITFKCGKCGLEIEYALKSGGVFDRPRVCEGRCPSKSFILLKDSPSNVFTDYQRITLHEIDLNEEKDARKGRTVQCILRREFVNTLLPGDAIHVLGVGVAEENEAEQYTLAVELNNMRFLKQRDTLQETGVFSESETEKILEMSQKGNILEKLTESIFQGIIGHQKVKEGLLLSLVGGSAAKSQTRRKEIHTLMVGDPGMGKSKMLRVASSVLPRSNYVCSTTSTSGGIGVSVHSKSKEYVLEAGALVLSDLGHCFIDELDKLGSPHVLFEAMETEKISVAKAGLVCTMPCRSSVIGAANPSFGRYIEEKPLSSNLGFSEAFLTRFDMVFLMLDKPEKAFGDKVSSHILSLHGQRAEERPESGEFEGTGTETRRDSQSSPANRVEFEYHTRSGGLTLEIAKKYVQYAREKVHPAISESAKSLISEFYTELRAKETYRGRCVLQTPTPRLVGSISRIAEAHAKIHLRTVATAKDVEFAIDLLTVEHQERKTHIKKGGLHMQLISHLRQLQKNTITYKEIVENSGFLDIPPEKIDSLIDSLNNAGYLLQQAPNTFKIVR